MEDTQLWIILFFCYSALPVCGMCLYIYKKRLKLSRKSSLSPVGFDGTIDMEFSFVRKMGVFPSHFIIVLGFASFLSVKFCCV